MELVSSTDLDELISALDSNDSSDSDDSNDSSDSDDSIEEMETNIGGLLGRKVSKVQSQTASELCFNDDDDASDSDGSTDSIEEMGTHVEDELGLSNAELMHHCPECPKRYLQKASLAFHMKLHNNNKLVKCEVCHVEIFTTKLEYDLHMVSHDAEKSYPCRICKRSFNLPDDLRNHRYTHLLEENEDESYRCPTDQYFQTSAQLSDQKKEKQSECSISQMKVQMHSHTNEKKFSRSESLKVHTRKHTGEKPYKCKLCDKGFPKSGALSNHQKNCARLVAKRKHVCPHPQCKKRYSHKATLKQHMKIHDKETTN